ncbi:MAG: tetratricopeptide repeat protein [Pseudomonadota bacterium]
MTERAPTKPNILRRGLTAATIVALAGLSGGCASTSSQLMDFVTSKPGQDPRMTTGSTTKGADVVTELEKATAYWRERFKENPNDVTAALSFARNLKAANNKRAAYAVLQQISILHGDNKEVASEYGRLALEFNQIQLAERLLAIAFDPNKPDWRVLSARGALYGKAGRFPEAIAQFERAQKFAPNEPSLANNLAMAYVAGGKLEQAEALLKGIALGPNATPRMRQNLALVLGLQGRYTEAKAVAAMDGDASAAYERIDKLRKATRKSPRSSKSARRAYVSKTASIRR